MRRLLISALLLCSAPVSAQHLAPEDYIFPLRNVAGLYSANFGEMRPNHFHSGIDIKTDGMTGKPVLATADGYISRIAVTPGGYGRAIYITHPNGTTSVYGHLSKFRDDIEKYVHEERYRTRRNSINLYTGFRSNRASSSPGREIQARPQARTCISRSATPARSGPSTPFPAA